MPEQQLNRAQVRTGLEQMRGVRMPQDVRRDPLLKMSAGRRRLTSIPHHLWRDRFIRAPAGDRAWKQPRLWLHPPPVRAQRVQQGRTERDIAVAPALAALDVNEHRTAVDVLHLQA